MNRFLATDTFWLKILAKSNNMLHLNDLCFFHHLASSSHFLYALNLSRIAASIFAPGKKKINTNISVVQTLRYGTFRQLSNMSDWFHLESKSPQNQMWTNPTIYFVTLLWNMSILHVLYMLGIILGLLSRTFAVFVHTLKCKMRKKALQAKTENKKKV